MSKQALIARVYSNDCAPVRALNTLGFNDSGASSASEGLSRHVGQVS